MDTIAIYCRLSDEDKDKKSKLDESESIQNQKNLLMKYAMERGWDIYKIYSDDDYSGLDTNRPEFNQMLMDAAAGKFNIILCKHQSRFSRDTEVIEKYLHRKFPEWNIRFISVVDNVDTKDKGNKKARQINSLVNEWYCEDISEAVRATFKTKREDGKFIGSFAPYGYIKDRNDKNKLLIDKDASKIVRMIFNDYLKGISTEQIAFLLNDKKIPNPTNYKQIQGFNYKNPFETDSHGLWSKTSIRRILRNEVYIGHMVQGKREKISYKSEIIRNNPRSKWIIKEKVHEPIIEEELFYRVQKRLDSNIRCTNTGKTHVFAGKVICLDCKSTMNKTKSSNNRSYLRCKLYSRGSYERLCSSHSISLERLKESVIEKLEEHVKKLLVEEKYAKNSSIIEIAEKYKGKETLSHLLVNELIEYIEIGEQDEQKRQRVIIHWKF